MKKNIFLFAFAVSALFAGCTQKEDMGPNGVETNGVHVVASAVIANPDSKVALGDGTEKISVTWTEGEVFSVLQGTASIAPAPFTQTGTISADGKSASFKGTLTGTAADCYAFSPALEAETAAATAVAIAMTGQDGTLEGSKPYMWAKGTYAAGEPLNFDFKQLTAILKLNMTFSGSVEGPATNVTFVADEGLIVRAEVNITGEKAVVTPTVSGNIALSSDSEVEITGNAATVYFNVLPATIKNLRVVATVGGQQYIGFIRKTCAPAASKAYKLDVAMTKLDNYYVSTTGTGIGESFANAMSLESFLALVKTNNDGHVRKTNGNLLDGKKFCFAEGTYEVPCFKIEYSNYETQVAYTLEGGYTSATANEGVTAFNRKDETGQAIITLGNQVELSVNGIIFDGKYSTSDKGKVRTVYLGPGEGFATLRMKDCILKNFNVKGLTKNALRGGVLRINKNGVVYLDNVEIFDNVADNRGGAIFLEAANSTLFMNRCLFYRNSIATNNWGSTINAASSSIVCMNNTTVIGEPGLDTKTFTDEETENNTAGNATVNGDGHLLIVNSTIISNEKNGHGAFRMGNTNGRGAVLMNNLISKGKAGKCIQAIKNVTSEGYNAYNTPCGSGWSPLATDTDYSAITLPDATLTNGAYVWTVDASQTNFATKTAVVDAVKAFGKDNGAFLEWLGEDAFGVDGRGNARNASKMQPGAYDAGL